jgi:hypothetical protein
VPFENVGTIRKPVSSPVSAFRSRIVLCAGVAAALAATRWPIAPPFLFDYDNVNFALALRQFAPLLSQPHRGYPLYVVTSRIIHWFGPSPEWTALLMGLVGSLLALLFLVPLARDMFGPRAAWIAPALLFFNPVFILAGSVDHVRTFLASGAIATAFFVWRGRLKTAAFVLGVAGGFRTEMVPVMFPLLLSPLLLQRVSWKRLVAPLAILAVTVAPWFLFTVWKSGGLHTALTANAAMLRANGHSFWAEGFTTSAFIMALFATYWNSIGGLSWIWAVPAAIRRGYAADQWRKFAFLAIWFIPPFLLSFAIQITDPDQTLASVAATCLAGSWALTALRPRWTVLACVLSVALFLFPLKRMGREATLPWIQRVCWVEANAIHGVAQTPGPRLVVIRGEYPTWRLLSYYFPGDWIQQGRVLAHANSEWGAPLPRLRSRLVVDERGGVTNEPLP